MNENEIELSHLRYFIALAEELHFGRAAVRLHMAQPPLTRQIQLLEARLACRLFERTSRSTRLTPAGAQFLERARSIVAASGLAFQAMQGLGRGEGGQLTVATAPSLMLGELPRVIRGFRKRFPRVEFRLSEMASSAILEAVGAGAADLGFVRGRDKQPDIETHRQWMEPMVAVLPGDHPLRSQEELPLSRLRAESFVFFPRHLGPSFYDEVIGLCRKAGFTPSVTQEARQWSSIVSLVSAGMGISIGPRTISALLPKMARFPALRGAGTTVRLVGRRGGAANPATGHFLEFCKTPFDA
jgi:DNA-binding transcriptional LysR family regulator